MKTLAFQNKTILITGAASGLGFLLASHISQAANAKVILVDIDKEKLIRAKKLLSAENNKILAFKIDLSKPNEVDYLCQSVEEKHGYIDMLINNAGIVNGLYLRDLTNQQIQKNFQVNTITPIVLSKFFLKGMLKRNSGHIINIASAAAYTGVPQLSDYAASKAAIANFTHSLRLEIKKKKMNIHTTLISPFYISTGMFEGVKTRFPRLLPIQEPHKIVEMIIKAIEKKKKRLITPWFVYTVFLVKALPISIFDAVLSFFGINKSMDEFIGKNSQPPTIPGKN